MVNPKYSTGKPITPVSSINVKVIYIQRFEGGQAWIRYKKENHPIDEDKFFELLVKNFSKITKKG